MKKFYTLAVIILSMVIAMTSCNNDENFIVQNTPITQAKAKPAIDLDLLVAATPKQMQYFDETYVVEIGGKQQTIKLSDMALVTIDQVNSFDNVEKLAKCFEVGCQFYMYPLGKINAYENAKVVSHKYTIKTNHPTEEFDCVEAIGFVSVGNAMNSDTYIKIYRGIKGDDENLANWPQINNTQGGMAKMTY